MNNRIVNIFLTGQTTLHWGRMEFGNIGNFYVISPFIKMIHEVFPKCRIRTTLQMSEKFCDEENIEIVPMELYYDFKYDKNLELAKEEYNIAKLLLKGERPQRTSYINEVLNADLVIDFSGDMWGENADFLGKDRFEVGLYKDLTAQILRPTVMMAGSPGPFNNKKLYTLIEKTLEGFKFISNRESVSTDLLKKQGFSIDNVINSPCPSFLFKGKKHEEILGILKKENLFKKNRPQFGFILSGWNFTTGPFDLWPRLDSDYDEFLHAIEFCVKNLGADVYLMSHSNGFVSPPGKFEIIHGRDYPIMKQLKSIIDANGMSKRVKLIDGIYDPWCTKGIINEFDMLISGRVHGAIAGLSQCVPTVIIDYGHEPKAHKSRGFSIICNQEQYLASAAIKNDIVEKIDSCWSNRYNIEQELEKNMSNLHEAIKKQFIMLEEIL